MSSLTSFSAKELSARFKKGELSAKEIAEASLQEIQKSDAKIGAFLTVFEKRVREKADHLDRKRAQGKPLGLLAGVPVAIKDNIHIKGEKTSCASRILENYIAPFDASVTRALESEDALLMGKTNMDEFAMGSTTENSAFQVTRNPCNLDYVPGGSSGGSAAAVRSQMVPLALGSDTGGSIRQPAAFCGNVGFKPSYGSVSRYGLVAFASSLDQIGPFANNVYDAARLTEVIARPCSFDPTCLTTKAPSYTAEEEKGIQGMRIAVPRHFLENLPPDTMADFELSLARLTGAGAHIHDVDLSILEAAVSVYYIVATAEASTNLSRFDGIKYGLRSPSAKTLDEVYELSKEEGFGREVKRRIMLGTYVLSSSHKDLFFKKACQVRARMIADFKKIFESADLIAMPTAPTAAFRLGAMQDPLAMYLSDIYTIGVNLAGLPAMSLPSGTNSEGLPFSLQLIGAHQRDAAIFRAAFAFEREGKNV